MKTSIPRLSLSVAVLATFLAPSPSALAQSGLPVASSLSSTPSTIDRDAPRVNEIITRAEDYLKKGKLNLDDRRPDQARAEFDKAVDTVLESGMDVRSNPRLQDYYLRLIENIFRMETSGQQPAAGPSREQVAIVNASATTTNDDVVAPPVGFLRDQKFEPSPLDELSKLELNEEEKKVTDEDVAKLEEVKATLDFRFTSNALINQYLNYYQGRGRATMDTGLRRSGRYMSMARRIFREEGVPEDIAWLGQVESAWRPTAHSWAAASGLWQFIPSTGSRYGLRQTAWVDERNSFEKATRASARYLKWLANRYRGNWELAMGAYNTGEGNMDRAIARAGVADFWAAYPYLHSETRKYVPNILATILIAKSQEKYGFRNIRPDAPLSYDVVRVPSATSLQFIASATDTSVDFIRSINPELRRDTTPRGEAYDLRVPPGKGKTFVALLKRVPAERRENARVVYIAQNEDLNAVSERTGVSVAQLQQWNPGADLK
ncbi:MAG: transglycosylase SLT domain-containing protein, partial [Pyrinomonadaceae bacterium]